MALQGDVGTFPVRELLAWLADRRASGILSLSRGMVVQRFHLEAGHVRLASSSEEHALLGRMLVDRGLLESHELDAVLASRGDSRVRLGRLLTTAGLVSKDELTVVLFEKIRDLVADALAWTDGDFVFDDRPRAAARGAAIKVSVDLRQILDRCEGFPVTDADVVESTDVPA